MKNIDFLAFPGNDKTDDSCTKITLRQPIRREIEILPNNN